MTDHIDRRDLLKRALWIVGAATTLPLESVLAAPGRQRSVFNASQRALVTAIADTIVPRTDTPGAVDAGVVNKLDAMIANWAAPATRADLLGAMQRIDARARKELKRSFVALSPAERKTLLIPHDVQALKVVPRTGPAPVSDAFTGPVVADPGYARLKELIVTLYYLSEAALTTELIYEHAPGAWQPSIPITPETRQPGGPGFL